MNDVHPCPPLPANKTPVQSGPVPRHRRKEKSRAELQILFPALNTPGHLEAAIHSKPKQPPLTKPEACSGRELAVKAPLAVLISESHHISSASSVSICRDRTTTLGLLLLSRLLLVPALGT